MNKCHMSEELSSYIDNQLLGNQKIKVEEHLKTCKICQQELARLQTLSLKLKAWHIPDLDASFDSSVRNEIVARELERGQVKMKKKTLAILVPSGALAGILVIVFLGNLMQMFVKRATQGRLQESASNIGDQLVMERGGIEKRRTSTIDPAYIYIEGTPSFSRDSVFKGYSAGGGDSATESKWAQYAPIPGGSRAMPGITSRATVSGEGSVIVIQPLLPATGEGEKIIRTAEIRLEVEDGSEVYKKTSEICQQLGGYLAASRFYKDSEGRQSGNITLRIPKGNFTVAVERLSALGRVTSVNTGSQDVGQEYANLKARLDAAMVVYNKMLEALQKRQTTIPEAMRLESELTPILRQIESLKNKIESLDNAVSFTTITLNFYEPEISAKALKESKRYIQKSLLAAAINAVRIFANAIPIIIVVTISLAIAFGLVLLVKYWIIRLFKRG